MKLTDPTQASAVEEMNKIRSHLDVSLIEIKKRPCLSCGEEFESESKGNRLCYKCKHRTSFEGE